MSRSLRKRSRQKKLRRAAVAESRIKHLYRLVEEGYQPSFHDRYVEHIRKLSTKYNVPLPRVIRFRICKGCGRALTGKSLSVRIRKGKVIRRCLVCGHIHRHALKTERKAFIWKRGETG